MHEARLACSSLSRDRDYSSFSRGCVLHSSIEFLEFLIPPDERRKIPTRYDVPTASGSCLSKNAKYLYRFGEALYTS
jgi:hypothetical protein